MKQPRRPHSPSLLGRQKSCMGIFFGYLRSQPEQTKGHQLFFSGIGGGAAGDCFNGTFQHREAGCPFRQGDTSPEGTGGDGMRNCVSPGSPRGVLLFVIIIIFKSSSFEANALLLLGSVGERGICSYRSRAWLWSKRWVGLFGCHVAPQALLGHTLPASLHRLLIVWMTRDFCTRHDILISA